MKLIVSYKRTNDQNVDRKLQESISKIVLDLLNPAPNARPTCSEILVKAKSWRVQLNDLPDTYINQFQHQSIDIESNFIESFLKRKIDSNLSSKLYVSFFVSIIYIKKYDFI
jgi:hypothetical protein